MTTSKDNLWVYDFEVFPNLVMVQFHHPVSGEWCYFDHRTFADLIDFVSDERKILGGFNNMDYDDAVLQYIVDHPDCKPSDVYKLSCDIINCTGDLGFRLSYKDHPWGMSIDAYKITNKAASLKEWECRNGANVVMDSDHPFDDYLDPKHWKEIEKYNRNDVQETSNMLMRYWELVEIRDALRKRYDLGTNVYCQSEASIAENVLATMHMRRTGKFKNQVRLDCKNNPDNKARVHPMRSIVFKHIKFETHPFREMMAVAIGMDLISKDPRGTAWGFGGELFDEPLNLAGIKVKIGVGGLHSVDEPGHFLTNPTDGEIVDLDVASFYPGIMVVNRLHPKHIGERFAKDMDNLRQERLIAKKNGDKNTNEALKIVINSAFGKLNDSYACIRSVPDALRVTINGQLMLLMLVERLHLHGMRILSANTDGVTLYMRKHQRKALGETIAWWQSATGHELEETLYLRYMRRHVNSYVALKQDRKTGETKVKAKGDFLAHPEWVHQKGKWDQIVVKEAAQLYLAKDIQPAVTIGKARGDIKKFLYYQRIKNGGQACIGTQVVGKTIRWYTSTDGDAVRRLNPKGTFASLPDGASASLAMDITDWDILGPPVPIDLDAYVRSAWDLIQTTTGK